MTNAGPGSPEGSIPEGAKPAPGSEKPSVVSRAAARARAVAASARRVRPIEGLKNIARGDKAEGYIPGLSSADKARIGEANTVPAAFRNVPPPRDTNLSAASRTTETPRPISVEPFGDQLESAGLDHVAQRWADKIRGGVDRAEALRPMPSRLRSSVERILEEPVATPGPATPAVEAPAPVTEPVRPTESAAPSAETSAPGIRDVTPPSTPETTPPLPAETAAPSPVEAPPVAASAGGTGEPPRPPEAPPAPAPAPEPEPRPTPRPESAPPPEPSPAGPSLTTEAAPTSVTPPGADELGRRVSAEAVADVAAAERYARMSQAQRDRVLNIQRATLDRLYQRRALSVDSEEMVGLEFLIERAETEINAIESAPAPSDGSARGGRASDEQIRDAQARVENQATDVFNLSGKTSAELAVEETATKSQVDFLTKRLSGRGLSTAERDALNLKKEDLDARLKVIETLRGEKGPAEEKAAQEQEARTKAEELERLRLESTSVPNLETLITNTRDEITDRLGRIAAIDRDLANPAITEAQKVSLRRQREQYVKDEVAARNRLNKQEGALKASRDKAREDSGLETKPGRETLRKMSVDAYQKLGEAERAKYLLEVRDSVDLPTTESERKAIINKMLNYERMTIEELAQGAEILKRAILKGGKVGKDAIKDLSVINNRYPDVGTAVLDAITLDETFQDRLKEFKDKHPMTGFDKMVKFASRNKGWMMILLAILAGATAGVAALAGPGLAVAAGGAGTAAGGGGAFGLATRE